MDRFSATTALVGLIAAACLPAPVFARDGESLRGQERVERHAGSEAFERDATTREWRRVVDRLQSLGYSRISDVDVMGDRFEVDAISPAGREVDVYMDRSTLRVLSVRRS